MGWTRVWAMTTWRHQGKCPPGGRAPGEGTVGATGTEIKAFLTDAGSSVSFNVWRFCPMTSTGKGVGRTGGGTCPEGCGRHKCLPLGLGWASWEAWGLCPEVTDSRSRLHQPPPAAACSPELGHHLSSLRSDPLSSIHDPGSCTAMTRAHVQSVLACGTHSEGPGQPRTWQSPQHLCGVSPRHLVGGNMSQIGTTGSIRGSRWTMGPTVGSGRSFMGTGSGALTRSGGLDLRSTAGRGSE